MYIPPRFRLSPLSLSCPYCKARRGQRCRENGESSASEAESHLERVQMASLADRMGALRSRAERRASRAGVAVAK
jgi:hypothetical protein